MKYFHTKYAMDTFITFDNSLGDLVRMEWTQVYICIYSFMVATFYNFLHFRMSLVFIYSREISHYTKYLDLEYSIWNPVHVYLFLNIYHAKYLDIGYSIVWSTIIMSYAYSIYLESFSCRNFLFHKIVGR